MGRRGLRSRKGQIVAVQLDHGVTLRGVLTGVYRDTISLDDVAHLTEEGPDLLLGQDTALIPRARISYVQVGPGVLKDALST